VFTEAGKKAELKATLTGHGATVESIAVEPRRTRVCREAILALVLSLIGLHRWQLADGTTR
jgi:hypothetical protein